MWVLTPGDPGYPGSPLDALLGLGPDDADLLVEAPGPVGLVAGVPAGTPLPERTVRSGDVLVLAEDPDAVAAGLGGEVPDALARLAGTTAPLAWWGTTDLGPTLVVQDGADVRLEVEGEHAEVLEAALASGSVPGSPGRRWSALLAGADVVEQDDRTVLTARATDALPPTLLRQLVDQGALPPR